MKTIFYRLELGIRYLKYNSRYRQVMRGAGVLPDIRPMDETLDKILEDHCSVSHYGDGDSM